MKRSPVELSCTVTVLMRLQDFEYGESSHKIREDVAQVYIPTCLTLAGRMQSEKVVFGFCSPPPPVSSKPLTVSLGPACSQGLRQPTQSESESSRSRKWIDHPVTKPVFGKMDLGVEDKDNQVYQVTPLRLVCWQRRINWINSFMWCFVYTCCVDKLCYVDKLCRKASLHSVFVIVE